MKNPNKILIAIFILILMAGQSCTGKLYNTGSTTEGRSVIRAWSADHERQKKIRWKRNYRRNYKIALTEGGRLWK